MNNIDNYDFESDDVVDYVLVQDCNNLVMDKIVNTSTTKQEIFEVPKAKAPEDPLNFREVRAYEELNNLYANCYKAIANLEHKKEVY